MQICQRLVLQVIFYLLENLNLKSRQFDSLPNDQCGYCQEVTQDPLFVAAILFRAILLNRNQKN